MLGYYPMVQLKLNSRRLLSSCYQLTGRRKLERIQMSRVYGLKPEPAGSRNTLPLQEISWNNQMVSSSHCFFFQLWFFLFHQALGSLDFFPDSSVGKESAWNAGESGSISGSERSPGERIGYPLQYSGLENSMDCIIHGVAKNKKRPNNFHFRKLKALFYTTTSRKPF